MSELLKKAQETLDLKRPQVNPEYKPRYHLSVPAGWLNDPNGFGYFQDKCHLFYQFHPYDSVWGPMHWGHWTSTDLLHWQVEPVAMAPDMPYDRDGVFSGTALEDGGVLYAAYTGVSEWVGGEENSRQQQCLARSTDGIHFEKFANNPVIPSALLPEGASEVDFRDPKIEKLPDGYRIIAASRGKEGGQLLSFRSDDLKTWRYEGVYKANIGEMAECPDAFELDGQKVVITSIIGHAPELPGYQTPVCWVGHEEDGRFVEDNPVQVLDWGTDYYAPQTALTPDGRRILISWAFSWGCVLPTHRFGHGWAGSMTVPRECTLENGKLIQKPIRELEKLRLNAVHLENVTVSEKQALEQCAGACREIDLCADLKNAESFCMHLMETGEEHFTLLYEKDKELLTISRENAGHSLAKEGREEKPFSTAKVALKDGRLSLRILVDISMLEIYVHGGETVLTAQAFPIGKDYGVSVCAKGEAKILALDSYEMTASV